MKNIFLVLILIQMSINPAFANSNTWKDFYLEHKNDFTVDYKYSTGDLLALGTGSNSLPAGTPVKIQTISSINSGDAVVGTVVDFKVMDDINVGGATVIKAGALGSAEVLAVDENGMLGEGGKLTIGSFEVKTANGQRLPLKGSIGSKGEEKTGLALVLGIVICFPFLFIKGKEASLEPGITRTVYTAVDYNF
jgi:hypothetical protein